MALLLNDFRLALLSPASSFMLLNTAKATTPQCDVCCTHHFAEAFIEWKGEEYIAMIPLREDSTRELLRRVAHLRQTPLSHLAEYRLLTSELIYRDHKGEKELADMVIYRMPKATALSEVITREGFDWQRLYESTYRCEELFAAAKVCHYNLKLSNLLLSDDYELLPIRYTYAEFSQPRDRVAQEFDELREWIRSQEGVDCVEIPKEARGKRVVAKFDSIEGEFEGLRVVCRDGRYGYIDNRGEEVIPTQYLWAEHFREGRAAIRTEQGMGLINNRGEVVIEPIYAIVDYNVHSGHARVKSGEQWAIFNHNGEQVTPFSPNYINEDMIENYK